MVDVGIVNKELLSRTTGDAGDGVEPGQQYVPPSVGGTYDSGRRAIGDGVVRYEVDFVEKQPAATRDEKVFVESVYGDDDDSCVESGGVGAGLHSGIKLAGSMSPTTSVTTENKDQSLEFRGGAKADKASVDDDQREANPRHLGGGEMVVRGSNGERGLTEARQQVVGLDMEMLMGAISSAMRIEMQRVEGKMGEMREEVEMSEER